MLYLHKSSIPHLLSLQKPSIITSVNRFSSAFSYSPAVKSQFTHLKSNSNRLRTGSNNIRATLLSLTSSDANMPKKTKGVVNVQPTISGGLTEGLLDKVADGVADLSGRSFLLEFVALELDPNGKEKETIKAYAKYDKLESDYYKYELEFEIPDEFGKIGAVLVENEYQKEMYIHNIVLDDVTTFICESWVQSKHDVPEKRIFFTDKSYLPSQTPSGVRSLREKDLESLRGNGEGERKSFERIYDYDTYDDIGDPDSSMDLDRPVLGGKIHPYPRRCRTGRKMSSADLLSESRTSVPFYVPRDEDFSEIKLITFGARALYSGLNGVIPILNSITTDTSNRFEGFSDIESLYNDGFTMPTSQGGLLSSIPRLIKGAANDVLKFEAPASFDRDSFSWLRDEEFCRQMLAGLNPYAIQLVTEWPLISKLDPEVYGPPESAITKQIIEQEIRGFMTFEQALEQKKLFILDYHDLLLPYVNKVRELEETTLYGSRTLMFLEPSGTLRPLAIELTRPPVDEKPQWKHVYTPRRDATGSWLWKLAKAQVLAHDSGHHELVSHWLRTHGVTEPYIIATNRQLSKMHPIQRLLCPHFRYTMHINSLARLALINAGGTIETCFSLGKYSMQFSSDVYAQSWRFDHEGLPADLISRGMASEDPSAPHGLKLTIDDYPFANDGLVLFDAIKQWATSYINHYYPQAKFVELDEELQAWWTEIRTVGHGDKKDEPWWPQLKTQDDLINVVTTIMWVSSGHHSAVNFGQYDFGGYFPNRPTIARTKMPDEDPTDEEWESFLNKPEDALLKCFPSQIQAVTVMAVLEILSSHSPDEEYIGVEMEAAWRAEPAIEAAFEVFSARVKELDGVIESRNLDPELRNRNGAGLVPYRLLKPFSGPGVTGMGVPYSISI